MPLRTIAGFRWFRFEDAPRGALAMSSTLDVAPDPGHGVAPEPSACAAVGVSIDRLAWCRQVHGNGIVASTMPGEQGEADALITDRSGLVLSIRTADCLPVFIVAANTPAIGLAHAGWRGVESGIVPHTVEALSRVYGAEPAAMWAGIGPGISAAHFEVGPEVAERFPDEHVDRGHARPHVDLVGVVCDQLRTAGVTRITRSGECTMARADRYPSYRREQTDARLFSLLALSPASKRS